jgi:hypothetical protein
MERSDEALQQQFQAWDRQIARLQQRCLAATGNEVDRLRAVLAELAAARERAWSHWEVARAGGMWVPPEDVRRFAEAMRQAGEAFGRAAAEGLDEGREPATGSETGKARAA